MRVHVRARVSAYMYAYALVNLRTCMHMRVLARARESVHELVLRACVRAGVHACAPCTCARTYLRVRVRARVHMLVRQRQKCARL